MPPDTTAPTVTAFARLTPSGANTNADSLVFTATFSESVVNIDTADFAVNGGAGSVTEVSASSGTSVDITVSGNGLDSHDGVIGLNIAGGADIADAAGNGLSTAEPVTDETYTLDNTAPGVTLSSGSSDPVSGAFPVTITFSEPVTGFAADDLSLTNAAASAFAGAGASYTVTITPDADGPVTVGVGANAAQDAAGNANTAATDLTRTADGTAPGVTLSSDSSDPTNGPFSVGVTFSEPVTGLALDDFSVTNGTASGLTGSDDSYTLTLTPSGDGAVEVLLHEGAAEDAAGNASTASDTLTRQIDTARPEVTLTSASSDPTNGPFAVTAIFTKPVTGLALDDFVVTNATASDLSGDGDSYTLTLTPSGDGAVEVLLPEGAVQDAAGNTSTASNTLRRQIDTVRPEVTLSSDSSDPTNGPFSVTATFTKSVTGLAVGDFAATNATVSDLTGSDDSYTLTLTPSGDGAVSVSLPDGAAQDAAGNASTASDTLTRQVDRERPDVTLTSASSDPTNGPFAVTAIFTKPVTGLALDNFVVTNATASDLSGDGDSYTLTITPSGGGTVELALPEGAAEDAAGNASSASDTLTRQIDTERPDVTLTSASSDTTNGPFAVTAIFTKPVTGLALTDFAVTNATVSDLSGDGDSYTLTITPSGDGTVEVALPEGAAEDAAGNTSTASNTLSRQIDTVRPEVTLTSESSDPANGPFALAAIFTKPVTGLALDEFVVTNATASDLSGDGDSYTLTITPSGDGAVEVLLPEGAVQDAAGNTSTASDTFSINADATAPVLEITGPGDAVTGAFTASFTFSEPVSGFELADVAVTNGAVSGFEGADAAYTALITPDAPGPVTVSAAAGAAADSAGNDNGEASLEVNAVSQANEIEVTISSSTADPGEVAASAMISNPGAQPLAFNASADVAWIDVDPMSGEIPSLGELELNVALNEGVNDLEPGDYAGAVTVTIGGGAGTAGAMTTQGSAETVLVDIPISLSVEERFGSIELIVTTPSGPSGEASFAYRSDLEAFEGLTLMTSGGQARAASPDQLFGVYDLAQSVPAGWRVESISCSGDVDGGSTFNVESGRATIDLDPGEALVCTFENVRDEDAVRIATQRAIRNFMIRRADRIIEAAPDLSRRFGDRATTERGAFGADIDGSGRHQMAVSGSLSGMRNAAAAQTPEMPGVTNYERPVLGGWDVWFAAEVSGISDDRAGEDAESDFGVAQLGVDYQVRDTLILGLLAQYDWMDETAQDTFEDAGALRGARVEGEGWMSGPYAVWRIQDSLVFDALAMYGRSNNSVDPLGLYRDDFETDRLMLRANLTGEFISGSWRLRPQTTITHFEETQGGYTDSLGIAIPEQSIVIGRLRAGPEIAWRHTGERGGSLELNTSLRAVWDYQTADLLNEAGRLSGGDENIRADARFGLSSQLPRGVLVRLETGFAGIGIGDFEATTARFDIRIPFGASGQGRGAGSDTGLAGGQSGFDRCCGEAGMSGFEQAYGWNGNGGTSLALSE